MPLKRVHILVKGRVQGVFYRANSRETAEKLGLVGWVKNRPDGAVEIIAEGNEKQLQAFVAWCHKGPPGANVTGVEADYTDASGEFNGFVVMYY